MDVQEWYALRRKKVKAPRGEYEVEVPDIVQLILDWKEAGVKDFSRERLPIEVSKRKVMRHLFLKYLKKPRISSKRNKNSIYIEDLLNDQADSVIIYKTIMNAYIGDPEKVAAFFRDLPKGSGSRSRIPGSKLQKTSNRNTSDKESDSYGKASL